jgi:hypothetical protein
LFCSAAKIFGIANKSNSHSCALTIVELRPKVLHFVQPRSENFWNCEQKHWFDLPHSENFGIHQQKQLKLTPFCLPRSQNFRSLSTETTQINSILFCGAAKILEFANKNNSN